MTFHDRPNSLEDLAFPRQVRATSDTGAIPGSQRPIWFFVPGKPQSKGRPRAAKRGKFIRLYTPEKTVSYESTVTLAASEAMAGRPPIDGPVYVAMTIALPIPASWSKRKQAQAAGGELLPITKPDADNVVKAVFDAINGVVWGDDTQVVDAHIRKRYALTPGVEVSVARVEASE